MSNMNEIFGDNRSTATNTPTGRVTEPVRVVDIIMSSDHPEYKKLGGVNSIGAIKYKKVKEGSNTNATEQLPYAYPISSTIRTLPLKNEIVLLVTGPSVDSSNMQASSVTQYYTTIVSVWAHPTHNASVDGTSDDNGIGDFPDIDTVNPLQPFPGDVLVEGRLGQSIRLTGAKHPDNIWTTDDSNGKPLTLISNGQKDVGNSIDHIVEDINKDSSSIYLTSDHIIPLEQARDKVDSYKDKPIKADKYKGPQVVINGGRLYFNAKEESILFSSKEAFGVSSNTINLDGKDYIGLDAKKIYLGSEALIHELEPVIKGDALELVLQDLFEVILGIGKQMTTAAALSGGPVTGLNLEGPSVVKEILRLKTQINPGGKSYIKSKKTFTE